MAKAVCTNEIHKATKAFFRRHPENLENHALADGVSFAVNEDGMAVLTVQFIIDTRTVAEFFAPAEPE